MEFSVCTEYIYKLAIRNISAEVRSFFCIETAFVLQIELLIKGMDVVEPWKHPQAMYFDSISVTELLNKYSYTASEYYISSTY